MDETNLNRPVTVTLFCKARYEGEWMPEGLVDAIEWLRHFLEEVPAEFRDSAEIRIDSEGGWEDSHYANIEIYYRRPPTEAEKRKRLSDERDRKAALERDERETLAALKAKYGS